MKISAYSFVYFASAIIVASSLLGCSNSKEVTYDSGGVSQTFAEGKHSVPNNFPLPIYPQSNTSGSVSANMEGDEHSSFIMLSSNDPVNKVSEFYKNKLKEDGWAVEQNQVLSSLVNLSAKKNDLEASVMISADNQKTNISLSVNKEIAGEIKEGRTFSPDKLNPPTD